MIYLLTATLQICGGTMLDWLVVEHYLLHSIKTRLWYDYCSLVTMCLPMCFDQSVHNLASGIVLVLLADMITAVSVSMFWPSFFISPFYILGPSFKYGFLFFVPLCHFSWDHLLTIFKKRLFVVYYLIDLHDFKLNKEDAMDRCKWRKVIKETRWSGWVWVGECFFWYRSTRVVPDQRPLIGHCCCCSMIVNEIG